MNFIRKTFDSTQRYKWLGILLMVILLIIILVASIHLDVEKIKDFLKQNQKWSIMIGIGIYFLVGFTFIPAAPLTVFFSIFFGPVQAVIIAVLGNLGSALLAYYLGKAFITQSQLERLKRHLPAKIKEFPIASPIFLIASRLFPIGKRGISYLGGAYQVPVFRYICTTTLFYSFSSAFLAFGGFGIFKLF